MKYKIFAALLFLSGLAANATTTNVNTAQSTATIADQ